MDNIRGPVEDCMDIDVIIRGIPKSKARELCVDIIGAWDPRYETTIKITRVEGNG